MIRLFFVLFSLLTWSGEPDGIPSTVAEIRQAYAAAHQAIEDSHHDGVPRNELIETAQYMVPAAGTTNETFCCYYELSVDGEEWSVHYNPYFITRKYNIAVHNFYEEYLYDAKSGRLLFVYIQSDGVDGTKNEERYYYGPDGLISEIIKGERTVPDKKLRIHAKILRDSVKTRLDAAVLR